MEASKSLSCENNTSTLFSAVPDSSNMYLNKDSNLISEKVSLLCSAKIIAQTNRVKHLLLIKQPGAGRQNSIGL